MLLAVVVVVVVVERVLVVEKLLDGWGFGKGWVFDVVTVLVTGPIKGKDLGEIGGITGDRSWSTVGVPKTDTVDGERITV